MQMLHRANLQDLRQRLSEAQRELHVLKMSDAARDTDRDLGQPLH
jgi:hypothetical protein